MRRGMARFRRARAHRQARRRAARRPARRDGERAGRAAADAAETPLPVMPQAVPRCARARRSGTSRSKNAPATTASGSRPARFRPSSGPQARTADNVFARFLADLDAQRSRDAAAVNAQRSVARLVHRSGLGQEGGV